MSNSSSKSKHPISKRSIQTQITCTNDTLLLSRTNNHCGLYLFPATPTPTSTDSPIRAHSISWKINIHRFIKLSYYIGNNIQPHTILFSIHVYTSSPLTPVLKLHIQTELKPPTILLRFHRPSPPQLSDGRLITESRNERLQCHFFFPFPFFPPALAAAAVELDCC